MAVSRLTSLATLAALMVGGLAPAPPAGAGELGRPPQSGRLVCSRGVLHVALFSPAQMCPRPLATTPMPPPRPATLHT